MRTIRFHALALGAFAFFTLGSLASAQTRSSVILNSVEVRQLVERGDRGDHERLAAHFAALSERYTKEAKLHTSMAHDSVGNPSRSLTTGLSAHCTRLAALNTESATTLRELAAYHDHLTTDATATAPANGARFEGGAGAPAPTGEELNSLATRASTPAEHRALEAYFLTLAKRYAADADQHVTLALTFQGTKMASAASLHDHLARLSRESAREAKEAAATHKSLASAAR